MIDNTNYAAAAAQYFEEAYELLEQHKSAYALAAARRSLEALVYDLCLRNNIDTRDETGRTCSLDSLIKELMDIDCIDGDNADHIRIIRQNGNRGVHVTGNGQGDYYAMAYETVQRLAIVLDYYAPPGVKNSPLQNICMAEKYATAGKITKAETICQNILEEYQGDVLLQARTYNCLCKICGRDVGGTQITQKVIDDWADEGAEVAITAKLLKIIESYEHAFVCTYTPEIEIGQRIRGYIVGHNEDGNAIVDFCYKEKGFFAESAGLSQIGDLVSGIVEAPTECGIRLGNVRSYRKRHYAVVYNAISEVKAWFSLLEKTESSAIAHFQKWIDEKALEYNLVEQIVPLAKEEALRQAKLEEEKAKREAEERAQAEAVARRECEAQASARARKRRRMVFAAILVVVAYIFVPKLYRYFTFTPIDLFENLEMSFIKCGDEWIFEYNNNSDDPFVQTVYYHIAWQQGENTVMIEASYDEDAVKENKYRIVRDQLLYEVVEYDTYTPVDVFSDLELSFTKYSGQLTVSYINHSDDPFVQSVQYHIEDITSEEGEMIRVFASFDENAAKANKYYVIKDTQEYRVDKCRNYNWVEEHEQVSEESKKRMMQASIEEISDALATKDAASILGSLNLDTSDETLTLSCSNVQVIEMYFLTARPLEWWEAWEEPARYTNCFMLWVCADLKITSSRETLYEGPGYFSVAFTNVFYDEEGMINECTMLSVTSPLLSQNALYQATIQSNADGYYITQVPVP